MEFFKHRLGAASSAKGAMMAVAIGSFCGLLGSAESAHAYRDRKDSITLYSSSNPQTGTPREINDGVEIEELLIVGRDMVKVRTNKGIGWIKNSQYQNLAQPEQDRSLVIQRATELRTRGGMSGAVKNQLGEGTVIREILFKGNHWYKVATDKGVGWVRKGVVENHTTARLEAVDCVKCNEVKPPPPIAPPQLKPIVDVTQKLPQPKPKPVPAPPKKPVVVARPEVPEEEEDQEAKRKPAVSSNGQQCALEKILSSAKRDVASRWGNRPRSRGQCALGVRHSLAKSGVGGVSGGLGHAIDYTSSIPRHGFVKLGTTDIKNAPPGSVIVFSGPLTPQYLRTRRMSRPYGNYVGHVTIKGDDGFFYTDGKTRDAAVGWSGSRNVSGVRNVAAIYVPGPELSSKYDGQCRRLASK